MVVGDFHSRADSIVAAAALQHCKACHGEGVVGARTCECVFVHVFDACYARLVQCASRQAGVNNAAGFTRMRAGATNKGTWGNKAAEYIADFELLSKRAFQRDPGGYQLFRWAFMLAADDKLLARRMGWTVQQVADWRLAAKAAVGRLFLETLPYGIYPPHEYFDTNHA